MTGGYYANSRSYDQAVIKKQKDTGIWGGNLLGLAPSVKDGIKEVGTIPQYRRLLQIGWPRGRGAAARGPG